MERFSMNFLSELRVGKTEKNVKTAKSTKRAKSKGNYDVKIVDGVKYMILK